MALRRSCSQSLAVCTQSKLTLLHHVAGLPLGSGHPLSPPPPPARINNFDLYHHQLAFPSVLKDTKEGELCKSIDNEAGTSREG